MRLEEAVRRLTRLPDPLPSGPPSLLPLFLEGDRPTGPLPPAAERPAAVLVLLVPNRGGEAHIVLTERVVGGRYHSGEVSFPGGRSEPDDADEAATALREAWEEVGLDAVAAGVTVLGMLDPVVIPVSGFRLTPILAFAERSPALRPAPAEVSRILEPPISRFLSDAPIRIVQRETGGRLLRYGAYPIDDLVVWGATARVLGQLGAILGAAQD